MAATISHIDTSFRQQNDRSEIVRQYHVAQIADGAATAQLAEVTALLPAIGSTYYSIKAYSRTISSIKDGTARASVLYRTEQFDDLIENAASGTIIAKGMSSYSEEVLRDRHPTSGATFVLGSSASGSIASIRNSEPRLEMWWEKKHTSYSTLKSAATKLTGGINNTTWNTYSTGKWLCVDVSSRQEKLDSGDAWIGRYSFAYKPETWVAQERTLIWNTRTVASITAATKATAAFDVFKEVAFPTEFTI